MERRGNQQAGERVFPRPRPRPQLDPPLGPTSHVAPPEALCGQQHVHSHTHDCTRTHTCTRSTHTTRTRSLTRTKPPPLVLGHALPPTPCAHVGTLPPCTHTRSSAPGLSIRGPHRPARGRGRGGGHRVCLLPPPSRAGGPWAEVVTLSPGPHPRWPSFSSAAPHRGDRSPRGCRGRPRVQPPAGGAFAPLSTGTGRSALPPQLCFWSRYRGLWEPEDFRFHEAGAGKVPVAARPLPPHPRKRSGTLLRPPRRAARDALEPQHRAAPGPRCAPGAPS